MSSPRMTRRAFVEGAAALAAVPYYVSRSAFAAPAPSDRMTLGFIGMGKQSRGHLQWALNNPETHVAAVCDVHDLRLQDAVAAVGKKYADKTKSGSTLPCDSYHDFRELLARDGRA